MRVRKIFPNIQSAHIVRNCTSERCSHSVHGHSTTVELIFESKDLDNAQMVMDFGLMKGAIKEFIDSMDHCYLLCNKDKADFCKFIKSECARYIEMPFNPSAEMLSVWIFATIEHIINKTMFNNGESAPHLVEVIYHETASGSAECSREDYEHLWCNKYKLDDIEFSDGVVKDWNDMTKSVIDRKYSYKSEPGMIVNPEVIQQIKL